MMMTVSNANLGDNGIVKTDSFANLYLLAMVAEKVYKEEHKLKPIIDMSIVEKKPLPFNLNFKPRTPGKPWCTTIDVQALLPCLGHKRKLQERDEDTYIDSSEIGLSRNSKKMRLTVRVQAPVPGLPLDFIQKIEELGGTDTKLVYVKRLYTCDVSKDKSSRLTMTYRQCKVDLGEIRQRQVKVIYRTDYDKLSETTMNFNKWDTVSSYVFTGSWNHLVKENDLKKDDVVQVWCFRQGDELSSFALVKL